MTHPKRAAVPLAALCLLAIAVWPIFCRPDACLAADPAGAPHERRLAPGGVPVFSLTYDERVFFDSDQDRPRPESASVLDALAARLRRGSLHIAVLGHTDALGSDAYNLDLSRRRARAVVRELMARGIDPARLQAVAIGKREPVAPDTTPAGRARNRRVEFLISQSTGAIDAVIRARSPDALAGIRPNGPLRKIPPAPFHVRAREPDTLVRAPLGAPVPY